MAERKPKKAKSSKATAPVSPFWDEKPLFEPRGVGADGKPLRCYCGCGRIADTINWNTKEPASWNCFNETLVEGAKARDAEREAAKAEKLRRMAEGRALARGEDTKNRRATA